MNKKVIQWGMAAFGIFAVLIYSYIVWYLSWHEVPEANKEAFADIRVTCRDLVFTIGVYLYGSSMGAKRNAETIATLAKNERA